MLKLNRSSFYTWKATAAARRKRLVDGVLLGARIKAAFTEQRGCYGTKRITTELNDHSGQRVNHKPVARIMSTLKLAGFTKKRRVITTVADKKTPVFPDLVRQNFTADEPNHVYVGDITYLPIAGGSKMYLATVIDCFSRRLVGFEIADHMRT